MQPTFIINPKANITDIKISIDCTISKLKAILNCIMLIKPFNHPWIVNQWVTGVESSPGSQC